MGRKVLFFDSDLCSGCLSCHTICSQRNEGSSGLANARLHLTLRPFSGDYTLAYCRQCDEPECVAACPADAILRHSDGYWDVDYEACIACEACMPVCSYGAMFHDPVGDKVIKCHTCQGDPACVDICPTGALLWIDETEAARRQGLAAAVRG